MFESDRSTKPSIDNRSNGWSFWLPEWDSYLMVSLYAAGNTDLKIVSGSLTIDSSSPETSPYR